MVMNVGAVLIGLVTGFTSAFFGIGGSSIDTPVIRTFLNLPPLQALATPLPLTILTASIAIFSYHKVSLIHYRVAGLTLLTAFPAMIIGSFATAIIPGKFLMLFTAVVLVLVGIDFIVKDLVEKSFAMLDYPEERPAWKILIVGGVIGILSGVLANGGGIFFVPAFIALFGLKIKEAIATSLLVVLIIALPGAAVQASLGHVNLVVMLSLALGVIPMAYLGAKLDIKTKSKVVMLLYGITMVVFGIYFFANQLMVKF